MCSCVPDVLAGIEQDSAFVLPENPGFPRTPSSREGQQARPAIKELAHFAHLPVPADEACALNREVVREDGHTARRGEIDAQAGRGELEQAFGFLKTPQAVLTEIAEADTVGWCIPRKIPHDA